MTSESSSLTCTELFNKIHAMFVTPTNEDSQRLHRNLYGDIFAVIADPSFRDAGSQAHVLVNATSLLANRISLIAKGGARIDIFLNWAGELVCCREESDGIADEALTQTTLVQILYSFPLAREYLSSLNFDLSESLA